MSDAPRFVFEYEVTQRDYRDWERSVPTTARDWVRFAIVVALLANAIWCLIQGRPAEGTAIAVAAGVFFRVGRSSSPVFSVFTWLLRMRLRVEIDDAEVKVSSFVRKSQTPSQTVVINWLGLARDGEAREYDTWFMFASGQGDRFGIPKRAFTSDEQISEFREFVRRKMGDRSRFSE